MPTWEYLVVTTNIYGTSPDTDLNTVLNTSGADGWELVTINRKDDDWTAIYKRPITPPTE